MAALVNTEVSIVLEAHIAKYPRPEDAKKHLYEPIVTYEHFQEAAKKVRSSRGEQPDGEGRGALLQVRRQDVW